ncbi:MAG: twin-arginine translocase subunit TatC [Phycisphaerae bacterium]
MKSYLKRDTDKKPHQEGGCSMGLGDHIEELRLRIGLSVVGIFVGMLISLAFGKFFFAMLLHPYAAAAELAGTTPVMQAIQPAEKFLMFMKCALIFGVIFSAPWVVYQLWKFVSPGLYAKETRFVYIVTPVCGGLFMAGSFFFILFVAPIILNFFMKFDVGVDYVTTVLTLTYYVNFMLSLTLAFGLSFQMPVLIVFAVRLGLLKLEWLVKVRKFVFLGLFIVAAMATPPDPISMLSLALPLYVLYESSIFVCSFIERRAAKKNEVD